MTDRSNSTVADGISMRYRANTVVLALLVFLAGLAAGPAAAQDNDDDADPITWGIRPSTADGPDGRNAFDLILDPGDTIEDYVGVSNFTTEPLELDVYGTDAFTTSDGHFDLLPAADEPTDVGSWVAFATETVIVPPRSRLDIPFRLTVPDRATPGDHAGGIVASLTSINKDPDGNHFAVDRRVGARIYLRVSGDLETAATVTDITTHYDGNANPVGTGDATVTYTVANTGNVRIKGTPTIELTGPFGLGRKIIPGPEVPELLPDGELVFTVPVSSVIPLGRITASVELVPEPVGVPDVQEEAAPTGVGRASTWAIPWAQIAAVSVLGLVFGQWRRRRELRRRIIDERVEAARAEGRDEALTQPEI